MALNEIPYGGEIRSQPLNENFQYLDQKLVENFNNLNQRLDDVQKELDDQNKLVGTVEVTQAGVQYIEFSNLDPSYSGDYLLTAIIKNDGSNNAQIRIFMNSFSSSNFTGNRLEFDGSTVDTSNSITNIATLDAGETAFLISSFGFDKMTNLPYSITEYTDSAGKNTSHRCKLTTSTGDSFLRTIRLSLITSDYAIGSRAHLYKR